MRTRAALGVRGAGLAGALAAALLALGADGAHALPLDQDRAVGDAVSRGGLARPGNVMARNFMEGRRPALAPIGHVGLCAREPRLCEPRESQLSFLPLTPHVSRLLQRVNARINQEVSYAADPVIDGLRERWRVARREGDCEDIALAKRERLLALGVPARAMRLGVGTTASGEGHAVLVVRTSAGDLVLDNRHDEIRHWTLADLAWRKIQSPVDPRRWYAL